MALTKHKLKKQMMEKTMERASGERRTREDNPAVLPYYKLDFEERLEILFIPYEDGDLFKHFKKHGPNMGNSAVGSIECIYHAHGESCPACAKGFSYVVDGKGTPESRKWMAKDYYIAQCVVIESPFDIPELEDGNQTRIFYMPYAVMEKIKESYAEGIVEDPTQHIFVIKKTKSKGDNASYANSYFRPNPIGDDVYEAFEDAVIEIHDLIEHDIQPKPATEEEVEEWVEKAAEVLAKDDDRGSKRQRRSRDEDENEDERPSRSSLRSDDSDEEEKDSDDRSEKPSNKSEEGGKRLSLQERLKRSRGG